MVRYFVNWTPDFSGVIQSEPLKLLEQLCERKRKSPPYLRMLGLVVDGDADKDQYEHKDEDQQYGTEFQ